MWDYLFFSLYLEQKDPTDFTGLETYCWRGAPPTALGAPSRRRGPGAGRRR